MNFPHPFFPGFLSVIGSVFAGVLTLLALAVALGVIFLLVRFLLVATQAAQLYVAQHSPVPPVLPAAPGPVGAPTPASSATAPAEPVTKPPAKPRTPKAPPTT